MVTQGKIKNRISDSNWFVYALKLENEKYYIGISVNPKTRFLEHQKQEKDSSSWCKKHKALKIIEVIETKFKRMKDATYLEDITALNYIKKFGAENVRGGRYLGSLPLIKKTSNNHIERGYISVIHKLIQDVDILYSELNDLGLYKYVSNYKNNAYLINLILVTRNEKNQKDSIIKTIKERLNRP